MYDVIYEILTPSLRGGRMTPKQSPDDCTVSLRGGMPPKQPVIAKLRYATEATCPCEAERRSNPILKAESPSEFSVDCFSKKPKAPVYDLYSGNQP